jgi:hypothetical protein
MMKLTIARIVARIGYIAAQNSGEQSDAWAGARAAIQTGPIGKSRGRPRVIGELRDLARAHAPEAVRELARLAMHAKSETARIAAIRELLDRPLWTI